METESTIRAFRTILGDFKFIEPTSFSEDFAQKRYLKKYESPDVDRRSDRRANAWRDWITFDLSLPTNLYQPNGHWYRARVELQNSLRTFKLGTVEITNGSEFTPTRGQNSVEAKMSFSKWECTIDAFDLWVDCVLVHRGLRKAMKMRFERLCRKLKVDMKAVNLYFYKKCCEAGCKDIRRSIVKMKLRAVTHIVRGSRFSTVPKNNEKDRPINVEPFCNMIVQRSIGNGLRDSIKNYFGLDLNTLADDHRKMITNFSKCTVDLSNASDSVSRALVEFLLPKKVFTLIDDSRSPFILGLDGDYHLIRKISSMGNGFTFELMTLVLLSLGRTLDSNFSVFGDDIICDVGVFPVLRECITSVGFVVNVDKTFVDGPFRESCGANYHIEEGYVESYDFLYPESINDCVVIYNKVKRLSFKYSSFKNLERSLLRCIPKALRGPLSYELEHVDFLTLFKTHGGDAAIPSYHLGGHFNTGLPNDVRPPVGVDKIEEIRRRFCLHGDIEFFYSFDYHPTLRSKTLTHLFRNHWAKYLMYLHSNGICKDILTNDGTWTPYLSFSCDQSIFRWKDCKKLLKSRD